MTPERLKEIEVLYHEIPKTFRAEFKELLTFARSTLDSQPKPCTHERQASTFYHRANGAAKHVRYAQDEFEC